MGWKKDYIKWFQEEERAVEDEPIKGNAEKADAEDYVVFVGEKSVKDSDKFVFVNSKDSGGEVDLMENYRSKLREQHQAQENTPERVYGLTVGEWVDYILGYVLEGTSDVMTLFTLGLIALYGGYSHQTSHGLKYEAAGSCFTRDPPTISRPDGSKFTTDTAVNELETEKDLFTYSIVNVRNVCSSHQD